MARRPIVLLDDGPGTAAPARVRLEAPARVRLELPARVRLEPPIRVRLEAPTDAEMRRHNGRGRTYRV